MDIRTLLSDEDEFIRVFLAVPRSGDIYTPNDELPLVAIALAKVWLQGEVHNTHWRFFRYGVECKWNDLTDEQRWEVRTRVAWGGQVKDYWNRLGYEDERWYTLEALL